MCVWEREGERESAGICAGRLAFDIISSYFPHQKNEQKQEEKLKMEHDIKIVSFTKVSCTIGLICSMAWNSADQIFIMI